jgi:hypothetical protein
LWFSPWQTASYETYPAVGRFEGDAFDPETWKPRAPTAAYREMRADDAFWAARKVMAFSDELIRAVVRTGQFSDPRAENYLGDVLIKRRDRIGRAYLPKVNPIVNPALDASGGLSFENAAVAYGFASAPARYTARWFTFDNATAETAPLGETESASTTMRAPAPLRTTPGSFVKVELSAASAEHPAWAQPVLVYFRRQADTWTLVGLERLP